MTLKAKFGPYFSVLHFGRESRTPSRLWRNESAANVHSDAIRDSAARRRRAGVYIAAAAVQFVSFPRRRE